MGICSFNEAIRFCGADMSDVELVDMADSGDKKPNTKGKAASASLLTPTKNNKKKADPAANSVAGQPCNRPKAKYEDEWMKKTHVLASSLLAAENFCVFMAVVLLRVVGTGYGVEERMYTLDNDVWVTGGQSRLSMHKGYTMPVHVFGWIALAALLIRFIVELIVYLCAPNKWKYIAEYRVNWFRWLCNIVARTSLDCLIVLLCGATEMTVFVVMGALSLASQAFLVGHEYALGGYDATPMARTFPFVISAVLFSAVYGLAAYKTSQGTVQLYPIGILVYQFCWRAAAYALDVVQWVHENPVKEGVCDLPEKSYMLFGKSELIHSLIACAEPLFAVALLVDNSRRPIPRI